MSRPPPRLQSLKGPPKGLSPMLLPLESSPVSVLSPGLWGRKQDRVSGGVRTPWQEVDEEAPPRVQ